MTAPTSSPMSPPCRPPAPARWPWPVSTAGWRAGACSPPSTWSMAATLPWSTWSGPGASTRSPSPGRCRVTAPASTASRRATPATTSASTTTARKSPARKARSAGAGTAPTRPPRPTPPRSSSPASPRASASPAPPGPPAPPPATASAPWASPRASSTSCRSATVPTSKTPPGTSATQSGPASRGPSASSPAATACATAATEGSPRPTSSTCSPPSPSTSSASANYPPARAQPRDHQRPSRTTSTSTTSSACAPGEPSAKPQRPRSPPGSGRESHPPAPTDPDVNLSVHPARAAQSSGRGAVLPVREQAGRTSCDGGQPCPCPFAAALQALVFPFSPADKMAIHPLAQRDHRGRVEPGEIGEPARQDRINGPGELGEGEGGAPVELPGLRLSAHLSQLFRADPRQETGERSLPVLVEGFAGPESVPEERERYDLIDATSPSVLAVRYLRLAGMEFQPDLGQPVSDRRPHLAGLAFGDAVHDQVSRPGEFHPRPLAEPAVHVSAQRAPIAQRSGGYAEFPLREQPGIAARDGTQPRSCCAFPAP